MLRRIASPAVATPLRQTRAPPSAIASPMFSLMQRLPCFLGAVRRMSDVGSSSSDAANAGALSVRQRRLSPDQWQSTVFGLDIRRISAASLPPHGEVRLRGRVVKAKASGKVGFVLLRQPGSRASIQVVVSGSEALAAVKKLTPESIADFTGRLVATSSPVKAATCSDVEMHCSSSHREGGAASAQHAEDGSVVRIVSLAATPLPLDDRSAKLDTRLNHRSFDLRSTFNDSVFRISSRIAQEYRSYLASIGFVEINTPKMLPTPSEGGSSVFKLDYFGTKAYLAQSPQLYKQMCVMGDMPRVFEVGQVFRAENSNTHRHLTEFVGLDAEMVIHRSYYEVLDVLEACVAHVLTSVETQCGDLVAAARANCPSGPIADPGPITPTMKDAPSWRSTLGDDSEGREGSDEYGARVGSWELPVLRLPFDGAMRLLVEGGALAAPLDDFSAALEKELGKLVKDRYGVDLVLVDRYPTSARPFYTQRALDDDTKTYSYDLLLRGEEICSGAQRLHDMALLADRAQAAGVTLANIQPYIDCFAHGAWPHGGFGIGLQRMVMLYLGLPDVRYATFFPRDPTRIAP